MLVISVVVSTEKQPCIPHFEIDYNFSQHGNSNATAGVLGAVNASSDQILATTAPRVNVVVQCMRQLLLSLLLPLVMNRNLRFLNTKKVATTKEKKAATISMVL